MKIELKEWTPEDRMALLTVCNGSDRTYLSDSLPEPYTEVHADWWLNMVQEHEGVDGIFRAICVDGEIVGNITVEQKRGVYGKDAELGYLLKTENWSQGIMTEAVRQICEIAFEKLDLLRITALVYEPNLASRRVLGKNQFMLEGLMHNAVVKNGQVYHLCVYGKCKEE